MSNTTKLKGNVLEIKGLDADWSLPGDLSGFKDSGLLIKSITFHPSAANDVMVIKQGDPADTTTAVAVATTATDPRIFTSAATGVQAVRHEYAMRAQWPYIDITDCTFNAAGSARVEIELW